MPGSGLQANAARLQGLTPQQFAQQLARQGTQGRDVAPNHLQMQQPQQPQFMHAAHAGGHDRGGQQYAYAQGRSVHGGWVRC